MNAVVGFSSPDIMSPSVASVRPMVQSVSRLLLSTVLGVAAPSMTTTPSSPQSNLSEAPRPLSAPTLLRKWVVADSRSIAAAPGLLGGHANQRLAAVYPRNHLCVTWLTLT